MTENIRETLLPIEETSRIRRLEAENFRLKNEFELLEKKYAETSARLEKVQTEASDAFRGAEESRQTISNYLQEARAQSLIMERALRVKTDEVARLRTLNQSLMAIAHPGRALDTREAAASAKRYVDLAAAIQSEEALQRGRAEWLKAQAPETGTSSIDGASRPGEAGAVSGTSLGGNAGTGADSEV